MKKIRMAFWALAAVLVAFAAVYYHYVKKASTEPQPTVTVANVTESEPKELVKYEKISDNSADYGIKIANKKEKIGSVDLYYLYPAFEDGKHNNFDLAAQNYAEKKFSLMGIGDSENGSYEITSVSVTAMCGNTVSYIAEGMYSAEGGGSIFFAYSVNIDAENGKIYLPAELFTSADVLKNTFRDGNFTQKHGMVSVLDEIELEAMMQVWRDDYGILPNIYFTKDKKLGVLTEVAQALGGYAMFEADADAVGVLLTDTAKEIILK